MDHNDRAAIDSLFGKLKDTARTAPQPDLEAQNYIQNEILRNPSAPYFMLQTIMMQNQALENLQTRLAQLEARAAAPAPQPQSSGGMFGRLFGGGAAPAQRPQQPLQQPLQNNGPWGQQPRQGGGFLAGAAQTAMGVAGGMLLGNAISSMFAGDEAHAAEAPVEDYAAEEEQYFEEPSFEDDGGDWE